MLSHQDITPQQVDIQSDILSKLFNEPLATASTAGVWTSLKRTDLGDGPTDRTEGGRKSSGVTSRVESEIILLSSTSLLSSSNFLLIMLLPDIASSTSRLDARRISLIEAFATDASSAAVLLISDASATSC
eukprot:CAMPEP_0194495046 /NCGR_PEP_ID=MMETSP0253-20130528/12770_1 /TAXON_ID=2966 /ORGANISM="Noctiluca scintillans" /LENGTH=130 /DNA_ID=CAMNT_0039336241 /DNA_START=145 /DNA_END=538 /DNA_ORIENTATION=+